MSQQKPIRSVILTPVPPQTYVRDVGYLEIDALNKKIVIHDDAGNKSNIQSSQNINTKINQLSASINTKMNQNIPSGTGNLYMNNQIVIDETNNIKSNDQYLNTRVNNDTIITSSYTMSYLNGDFYNLSTNIDTELFTSDIPLGCAIVARITTLDDNLITFKEENIIAQSGTYYISIINPNGTTELMGKAIKI